MTANQLRPRASVGVHRRDLIERRLRRYSRSTQERVRAVAERHPRLADLALSFPPLLLALALPRPGDDPEPAITCAIEGRPLDAVATAAGVPRWLRRLPVDGLTRPLPVLPTGALLGRRIINHLPRSPKLTDAWLGAVSDAAQWGHEPFAIWIAREFIRDRKTIKTNNRRLLGLWSWFSQHPEADGHRLIETRWHHEMCFDRALGAARSWHGRMRLELDFGEQQVRDLWLRPGQFEGYDFVPLDSAERLADEAAAMENCVRTYAGAVADNYCRLWSIRRDGQRIATLDTRCHRGRPLVFIKELKAARNELVSIEIWWLATRWLHQHDLMSIRPQRRDRQVWRPDVATWRRLWRAYWCAKRRIPDWLPLAPSWQHFNALE